MINPDLVKKKIYKELIPKKPRFEMKKLEESEFNQKKIYLQYRGQEKTEKYNTVNEEQDQIISHKIEKRIKSFSSPFIKKP